MRLYYPGDTANIETPLFSYTTQVVWTWTANLGKGWLIYGSQLSHEGVFHFHLNLLWEGFPIYNPLPYVDPGLWFLFCLSVKAIKDTFADMKLLEEEASAILLNLYKYWSIFYSSMVFKLWVLFGNRRITERQKQWIYLSAMFSNYSYKINL